MLFNDKKVYTPREVIRIESKKANDDFAYFLFGIWVDNLTQAIADQGRQLDDRILIENDEGKWEIINPSANNDDYNRAMKGI